MSVQLVKKPKRTLGALGLGLCAAAVAVGSGADFSAEAANPANTFSAGSLSIDNSRADAAIFSPTSMKPGAPAQTGTVDIRNTGSLPGDFTLTRDQLSSTDTGTPNPTPFAAKVVLTVVDCGAYSGSGAPACGDSDDVSVYDHAPLSGMDGAIRLGRFAADERHRFQ
ncbi:MAG: spore coat-associated protein, partial [Thermoleophilaceae bacterium]|nr:spore coat-associated protein [Thermoleophilaceae bacterium]